MQKVHDFLDSLLISRSFTWKEWIQRPDGQCRRPSGSSQRHRLHVDAHAAPDLHEPAQGLICMSPCSAWSAWAPAAPDLHEPLQRLICMSPCSAYSSWAPAARDLYQLLQRMICISSCSAWSAWAPWRHPASMCLCGYIYYIYILLNISNKRGKNILNIKYNVTVVCVIKSQVYVYFICCIVSGVSYTYTFLVTFI